AAEQQPGAVYVVQVPRGGEAAALRLRRAGERLGGEPGLGRAGERVMEIGAEHFEVTGDGATVVALQLGQPAAPIGGLQPVVAAAESRLAEPRADAVAPAADEIGGGEKERRPRRLG